MYTYAFSTPLSFWTCGQNCVLIWKINSEKENSKSLRAASWQPVLERLDILFSWYHTPLFHSARFSNFYCLRESNLNVISNLNKPRRILAKCELQRTSLRWIEQQLEEMYWLLMLETQQFQELFFHQTSYITSHQISAGSSNHRKMLQGVFLWINENETFSINISKVRFLIHCTFFQAIITFWRWPSGICTMGNALEKRRVVFWKKWRWKLSTFYVE